MFLQNFLISLATAFFWMAEAQASFSASDISILVPLKAFKPTSPQDPFKIEGDGMCNAPTLNVGGTQPILSRKIFDEIAGEAFGKIHQIAPAQDANIPIINEQLKGATPVCGSPFIPPLLSEYEDADLLQFSSHLALIKGINPDVCVYENWRVVGFRFDSCLDRVTIPDFDQATSPPPACRTREARLVIQPFVKSVNGNSSPLDVTMHLIYDIPDVKDLLQDLKTLQGETAKALVQFPWGTVEENDPRMLRPHPGLRSEMGCQEGQPRPVGEAFQALLTKHTNVSRLTSIAFMTSSAASGQWSFSVREVKGGRVKKKSFDRFESFSLKEQSAGKLPFNIDPAEKNTIRAFYENAMDNDELLAFSGVVNDIVNPRRVSQVTDDKEKTSTCVSCHLPEFTLAQVAARLAQPQFPGIRPYVQFETPVPIWRSFKFAKRSNIQNLRNFGYGPAFTFGVSQRAIHETDELRTTLQRMYND